MNRVGILIALVVSVCVQLPGQKPLAETECNSLKTIPTTATWTFAVSGDSRNCGDVIMPAIAEDASKHSPQFYWHLGDFRWRVREDEDMRCKHLQDRRDPACKSWIWTYWAGGAWKDFQQNQVRSFGTTPVVLGIGNHEMIGHQDRDDFTNAFNCWLDAPLIKAQRLQDDNADTRVHTYYHWIMGGVDFINLDNAGKGGTNALSGSKNLSFTGEQVKWLKRLLERDKDDPTVKALVVGMHAALPDSFSLGHSMSESQQGIRSGRSVYGDLWKFRNSTHKPVYLLASHSHYYMENIYNTKYWRDQGMLLPGWIVGTAGARRYAAPKNATTNIYGYILATVNPDGKDDGAIKFEFHSIDRNKMPKKVVGRFDPNFISWCFDENSACKKGRPCEPDEVQ